MLKNIQNKKQNKELFKNIFKNIQTIAKPLFMRVSGLFPAVQTAASRPTKPKRKAEKYAEKSMHIINKQKKEQRKKGKERCTTNTKKYA